MISPKLVKPRILSGFMELAPCKQIIFNKMIDIITKTYENACFVPLDTPILELSEILLAKSGGEIDKEVYHFNKGDNDLCMRYDLTVPLARHVAMNSEAISFPFKRYQIGKAYRGERPQKGRFREFVQCDGDIVGLEDLPLTADAECIYIISKIFKNLNLDVLIHISNRNLLFGYCEDLNIKDTKSVLTILDKINKIGKDNAKNELLKLNLSETNCEKLLYIISLNGNFQDTIDKLTPLSQNQTYILGLNQIKELYRYIKAYEINEEQYCLDLSIIRGQDYYTGTVFETFMKSHPEFGSICGGGRYDNLAGYFTEKKMPGVGLSIGLTRLFDLLDKNNLLPPIAPTNTKLQIIPLGDYIEECLSLQSFFSQKLNCEVNYENRSFKSKMKEAGKKQIPYILIVGENEHNSKKYTLKNMITGEQNSLTKEDCLIQIKNNL